MANLIKRILLTILIVATYFLLWRPVREFWATSVMHPAIVDVLSSRQNSDLSLYENESDVSVYLAYSIDRESDSTKLLHYKVSGGLFMLIPFAVLPFITRKWLDYAVLFLFHITMILSVSLITLLALAFLDELMLVTDFSVRYLIPLLSMAYIPVLLMYRKNKEAVK